MIFSSNVDILVHISEVGSLDAIMQVESILLSPKWSSSNIYVVSMQVCHLCLHFQKLAPDNSLEQGPHTRYRHKGFHKRHIKHPQISLLIGLIILSEHEVSTDV